MYLHIDVVPHPLWTMVRFAPIFMVGALLYLYRDRVPNSGYLAFGLTVLAAAGLMTGQSNMIASDWLTGPALVYPVLWLGAHLPCRWFGATNDISYGVYIYGWPVGQLLVLAGVQAAGYFPYMLATLVCTVPLAAASWRNSKSGRLRHGPGFHRPYVDSCRNQRPFLTKGAQALFLGTEDAFKEQRRPTYGAVESHLIGHGLLSWSNLVPTRSESLVGCSKFGQGCGRGR